MFVCNSLDSSPITLNFSTHLDTNLLTFEGTMYRNANQSPVVEHKHDLNLQSESFCPVKHLSLLILILVYERPFITNSAFKPNGGDSELQLNKILESFTEYFGPIS